MALPSTPHPEYAQHLGAQLPLSLAFYDDGGAPAPLGQYFHDRPVVLVLGYYQCPNLCSTVMEGVLEGLASADLPRDAYRVLEVSIDPAETPDLAAHKKAAYEQMFGKDGVDLHLLTGDKSSIALLAQAVGFRYFYDSARRQYLHPAGFVLLTADGRISRYFLGVRFLPEDLRTALRSASDGNIGGPIERLLLLCSHYDPVSGRHSQAAMMLVRAACITVLAALAGWIWRRSARQGGLHE
jgi:protein SCO1/2